MNDDEDTWLCRCDCGREVIVRGEDLRSGRATSCGECSTELSENERRVAWARGRLAAHEERRKAVWAEWNSLPDDEPSPVKRIAAKLGMSNADVSAIVYPPVTFGRWADDQEPALP